jgi:hypothetical protein
MFQANTLNFRLRLGQKEENITSCPGNYFIELTCESCFDLAKSFSETIFYNSEKKPFYDLIDAAEFSAEVAAFWQFQLLTNNKIGITGVEELADVWKKFSILLYPFNLTVPRGQVYKF